MKMHRIKSNNKAVSAVIGVIIMVAITVAMAAVAYMYFTGMIGGKPSTPTIAFTPSTSDRTIQVTTADIDVYWKDVNISVSNSTGHAFISKTGIIRAGNEISLITEQPLRGTVTVTILYVPTNSLLGTYTIDVL